VTGTALAVLGTLVALVGAVAGALTTAMTGRSTARKSDVESEGIAAKLPAEVDSVVVQGAEQAVITMAKALEAANQQNAQLLEENERQRVGRIEDRQRIEALEAKVRELLSQVDRAESALHQAREATGLVSRELEQLKASQDQRDPK
jgi:Na+/phosphate symporter